jgi:hypothetical protein
MGVTHHDKGHTQEVRSQFVTPTSIIGLEFALSINPVDDDKGGFLVLDSDEEQHSVGASDN